MWHYIPYNILHAPYTIYRTPYTVHHTTWHHTPDTILHTPYTVHHIPYYVTLYTIQHTPYTNRHIPCTIHHTPYHVTLYTIHQYIIHRTMWHYTPYTILHAPYTIHRTPYTIHRTMWHHTRYTMRDDTGDSFGRFWTCRCSTVTKYVRCVFVWISKSITYTGVFKVNCPESPCLWISISIIFLKNCASHKPKKDPTDIEPENLRFRAMYRWRDLYGSSTLRLGKQLPKEIATSPS